MKKPFLMMLAILIFSALVLSACGGSSAGKPSVPSEYAGLTNPLGSDAADAGKTVYQTQCVSCHGESGMGDGPAGKALTPPAADLTKSVAEYDDDYLHYRIAEGGAMDPYNSSMPAFKSLLSEDEIWQVVAYINTFK